MANRRADFTSENGTKETRSGADLWRLVRNVTLLGIGKLSMSAKVVDGGVRTKQQQDERAKQLDNGFFEKFNGFQRNDAARNLSTDEDDSEGTDELAMLPSGSPTVDSLAGRELEEIYKALLKTTEFWLGAAQTALPKIKEESHAYIRKAFGVKEEQHHKWLSWMRVNVKAPKQCVRVSVVEGRNLPAKDPNGLSDPYCILGVVQLKPEELDGRSKTKHLKELVEDESKLAMTAIQPMTLNPKWNDEFNLAIEDLKKDYIQIDIWDSDKDEGAAMSIGKIRGFLGVKRYFHQMAQTVLKGTEDDFMGRAYVPLRNIPAGGMDHWIHITTRRQRQKKGEIRVNVQLLAENKGSNKGEVFEEHWKVVRQFVCYEATYLREKEGGILWHGLLSTHAVDIRQQHAIQSGVTGLQMAVLDWLIAVEQNRIFGVKTLYLLRSLKELDEQWKECLKRGKNPVDELGRKKIERLASSLDEYHSWAHKVLIKMRHVFPASKKNTPQELLTFLQGFGQSFELDFTREHFSERKMKTFVESAVSEAAHLWFAQRYALNEPQIQSFQNETLAVAELGNECVLEWNRSLCIYNPVFQQFKIDFFYTTFKELEKLLSGIVSSRIADAVHYLKSLSLESSEFEEVATATFKLYLTVKEALHLKIHLPQSCIEQMELFQKQKCFRGLVHHWFDLARQKAMNRINRALELDKAELLSDSVKCSSSAVDVAALLSQMVVTWKQLEWPDPVRAYNFLVKLTERICSTAKYYADRVHDHLKKNSYFDDEGQFDITNQLCITLNNVEYVRTNMLLLPVKLNWERTLQDLGSGLGRGNASSQGRETLRTLLASADEDLENEIIVVIEKIGERMKVDIEKYAKKLLRDSARVKLDDSIGGLMEYLQDNLQVLSEWLLDKPFAKILDHIYHVCIEVLYQLLKERYDLDAYVYQRVSGGLQIIRNFFYSGGKGVDQKSLQASNFQALVACVERRQKSSQELVFQYIAELEQEQDNMKKASRGYLTVQVGYIKTSEKICVKILNGRDMPALDPNGLSDLYVKFLPFPLSIFGENVSSQRTSVQKKTLTPMFDATFYVPIAAETLERNKTAIVFSVFDWDRFSGDDMAGEGIVLLSGIPHVSDERDIDYGRQITLKLRLPPEPEGETFRVLTHRTDKEAVKFVKKRQKLAKLER
eukprot:m.90077 g.90077  ORF g.90077 m.90077 type:complete len:1167 (+) comp36639_c0_seq15:88-3588(+)